MKKYSLNKSNFLLRKILLLTAAVILTAAVKDGFAQQEKYLKNRIMIEGFYIRNLGNFAEVWENASGGYIGYSIAFPDHNLLIMRTGFINNSPKDSTGYEDASLTIIPIELGGRYYFSDDTFMPFVQFMPGLNLVFENMNLEGEKENRTLVKFAWQVGFGLTFNITRIFNFDIGVNYQSNFYQHDAMNTGFEYAIGFGASLD
ncbi:MAG: hypothetical protein ACM34O_11440 [Ignavibacteria bacterium]